MNTTVRYYLIDLARKRTNQTITYQKLSDECKLGLNMKENPNDRLIMGAILGEISIFEHQHKRPLLSSLVLRAGDSYEGDGFYKLADQLGYGDWQKLKREGIFEAMQISECISKWQDDTYYLNNR